MVNHRVHKAVRHIVRADRPLLRQIVHIAHIVVDFPALILAGVVERLRELVAGDDAHVAAESLLELDDQ